MSNLQIVTYSPAYTLVPTYECFNRCSYCNFRREPLKSAWLELGEAEKILSSLKVVEILILSGEVHPQSPRRAAWFERIYELCKLGLSMGFLPHTNVGPLSFAEMRKLKEVNVSMGLMLEQVTPALSETVHKYSPSKQSHKRIEQLEWAGELQIPFTTGLLLGIGESSADWENTLTAIANIQGRWSNIQEVILQPYSPGTAEEYQHLGFNLEKLPNVIALARQILPSEITLQIPPNLVNQPHLLLECIKAGARDLGGIGPWDEVNPNYPHPNIKKLRELLKSAGYQLKPRLPVYPQYINSLPVALQEVVSRTVLID